jgi:hypothetical protein
MLSSASRPYAAARDARTSGFDALRPLQLSAQIRLCLRRASAASQHEIGAGER